MRGGAKTCSSKSQPGGADNEPLVGHSFTSFHWVHLMSTITFLAVTPRFAVLSFAFLLLAAAPANAAVSTWAAAGGTSKGKVNSLDASLVTSHYMALSGLVGSALCHDRMLSRDAAVNHATSADATSATSADVTAPVISAIMLGTVPGTTAVISWSTDEASDSQVEYGLTEAYGSTTTIDSSMVMSHSVSLSGLAVSTTYHYRVLSRDAAGNLATSSDGTFTTINGAVAGIADSSSGIGSGGIFGALLLGLLLFAAAASAARGMAGIFGASLLGLLLFAAVASAARDMVGIIGALIVGLLLALHFVGAHKESGSV